MGVFDNTGDIPGKLSKEALQVTLKFEPDVPNVGQATISWNIPSPENPNSTTAYAGIAIIFAFEPVGIHNIPRDAAQLVGDPTFDPSLFSGTPINNAYCLAYIYEPDVITQGGTPTTSVVVSNYDSSKNYYIAGYIMDAQRRFDQNGVRAYSDRLHNYKDAPGKKAQQPVLLAFDPNTFQCGVLPTDGTNLVPGAKYQFQIIYDSGYPKGKNTVKNFLIGMDGSQAGTYGDMVKEINKQIAIQSYSKTIVSPIYPGQGVYYWNGTELLEFDGQGNNTPVANVIIETNDPSKVSTGTYWFNPSTNVLQQWNGTAWTNVQLVVFPTDPTTPSPGTYWWNGTTAYTRCGDTWCEVLSTDTYSQTTDPSCPLTPVDCAYWYNSSNSTLYNWANGAWVEAYAVTWPEAPNALTLGTYWFNLTSNLLYQYEDVGPISTITFSSPVTTFTGSITTSSVGTILTAVAPIDGVLQIGQTLSGVNVVPGTTITSGAGYSWYVSEAQTVASTTITATNVYIDGTYTNIALSGGSGTGAIATITVAGGVVTNVTITTAGTGYQVGDILTVQSAPINGGTFIITVTGLTSTTSGWVQEPVINSTTDPALVSTNAVVANTLWYDPTTETLSQRNSSNTAWNTLAVLVWPTDPTSISSCSLWFDSAQSPAVLNVWDAVNSTWDPVTPYYDQTTDPYGTPSIATDAVWYNPTTNVLSVYNGTAFDQITPFISSPTDPTVQTNGNAWYNTTLDTVSIWGTPTASAWNTILPITATTDPTALAVGQLWFNNTSGSNSLNYWDGTKWVNVQFVTVAPFLQKGQVWYNENTTQLLRWSGTVWNQILPKVMAKLDARGNLLFETTARGSSEVVIIPIPNGINYMASGATTYGTGSADYINDSWSPYEFFPFGTQSPVDGYALPFPIAYNGMITGLDYFGDFGWGEPNGSMNASDGTDLILNSWVQFSGSDGSYAVPYKAIPISPNAFLWSQLKPPANILLPTAGEDGVSGTPTYATLGVGTDGNPDERRNLMSIVRTRLGYPTTAVELTDTQLDRAVTNALETFRQKSSMATFPAAFFLDIEPYNQIYNLTNKAVGYNKVVDVLAGYRFTSSFLSSAMGAGVYGQVVLQHLYSMGTFDLLSYHIVSQYVEALELMFAVRLTYWWNANTRVLRFHQSFVRPERILLAVTIEKTEQELFQDRFVKQWIQRYAMAEAMDMLANVRGKYTTLPGASGSVQLNATDLRTQAQQFRELCQDEIDNYIVQDVESYGAYGNFAIG